MKICFPVQHNEGIESSVHNHFGSAPLFVLVDTETDTVVLISNSDQHHLHGACSPLKALDNKKIDAVVVGGIGGGALSKLNQIGIKVYRSQMKTIRENLALFVSGNLPEVTLRDCCSGHSRGENCAH